MLVITLSIRDALNYYAYKEKKPITLLQIIHEIVFMRKNK